MVCFSALSAILGLVIRLRYMVIIYTTNSDQGLAKTTKTDSLGSDEVTVKA